MRKSDPEEPPKLDEGMEEREGRKRSNKHTLQSDSNEKMLEEKYYRYWIIFRFDF